MMEAIHMKRNARIGLTTAICLCTASSAYAHHSHPFFYDECKSITIEGRVERVEFRDPHTRIVLRLDDGTAYTVDWAPLSRLTKDRIIGPAKEALVFGARVVVTGNRIRDAAQIREHFPDFKSDVNPNTVDPGSIRRVDDSFNWALPPRANPPNCDRK
jgi:ribosomal protein L31